MKKKRAAAASEAAAYARKQEGSIYAMHAEKGPLAHSGTHTLPDLKMSPSVSASTRLNTKRGPRGEL